MNKRLKELRKQLKLTQALFAEQIGLKATAIGMYESGDRNITEQTIKLICSTFNVNEIWLRTGEGEMFKEVTKDDLLTTALANAINDNDMFLQGFITTYDKLSEEGKKIITNFIKELASIANLCEGEESNKKEED